MSYNYSDARIFNQELPKSIDYPNVPVGAILKGSANQYSNRDAFIYGDYRITFDQLYRESLRFANALRKLGIGKGTIVSIHLPTCPQYIVAYYGIVLTGATYSPINPALPIDDLLYYLNDSGARAVITHEKCANLIQKVFNHTHLESAIVTGDQEMFSNENPLDPSLYEGNWFSFAALKASSTEEQIDVPIDSKNDLVHIAYTGGTTGKPKGVMTTHENLIANVIQTAAWMAGCLPRVEAGGGLIVEPFEEDEAKYLAKYKYLSGTAISLSPSPLFHTSGMITTVVLSVLLGNTTVLCDRFEPGKFLADIERYQVTFVSGAPAMWNILLRHPDIKKYDYSLVTHVGSGAAPIAKEQMKLIIETFPNAIVTEGYGLTESTGGISSSVALRDGLRKLGTVGHPIFDTEVKLFSTDGTSKEPLSVGEVGEICVRGPQVMKGYFNKPEETAETLKDGWLHTGDIGVFDEDGLLSIVDRKKDMLIYNGYNVYPSKLEELLFQHPAVANAIVIGKPVEQAGEIPKAFVILKGDVQVTAEELMEFVNRRVVHYTKIRELEFVSEYPVTAAGKISKKALRDMEMKAVNSVE